MPWLSRLINVFRHDRLTRDIDEELQSHISEAISQGRDPDEARKSFGPLLDRREESRDLRLLPWLDSLRADAVFSARQIWKTKLVSAAAVLSLALAIGSCISAFRLIDALLLRPLPVANADRLYVVSFQNVGIMDGKVLSYDSSSYPMFRRMRETVSSQAELIAVSYADRVDLTFGSDQDIERAWQQYVSGWMFRAFELQPALGRLFTADDDLAPGAHPYAVISYDYWTRRFGRDSNALGKTFRLGNVVYRIIGVAPETFNGTETGTSTDVFLPMAMKTPSTLASSNNFWLRTLVQLKPGVAPEPVHERLRATFRAIQEERAKGFVGLSKQRLDAFFKEQLLLKPAGSGSSNMQREYRASMIAMGVLVALVLLIACANVANWMTARAAARSRELALRVSIGAGPWRLMQLVFVESAWIAAAAALAGAMLAWWAAPFVVRQINPPDNPARLSLPADWRLLLFALAMTLVVTFLFGLGPALRASAVEPVRALKGGEDPHARRRLMHGLIAAQVAFCFIVQFVAGLLLATFERLSNLPNGFSSARIVNLETLARTSRPPVYWNQVAEHLRTLPGVEKVSLIGWPLMSGESRIGSISVNGAPPQDTLSDFVFATPGWLDEMRIPRLDGRDFRASDTNPGVAMVNRAFAKQFFNGENPVGKSFERVDADGARTRVEIIALVADARTRDLRLRFPIRPTAYLPFQSTDARGALQPIGRGTFVIRTSAPNPLVLAATFRKEVAGMHTGLYVSNIRTQDELISAQTVRERLLATLALFFAGVALLLAGVGLYGVLNYSVLQRQREIGISLAIGARGGDIARRVLTGVLAMVFVGACAGYTLGMASMRYIQALLYEVKPTEAAMLAPPVLTILAAVLLASMPAVIRAIRIDPAILLRSE